MNSDSPSFEEAKKIVADAKREKELESRRADVIEKIKVSKKFFVIAEDDAEGVQQIVCWEGGNLVTYLDLAKFDILMKMKTHSIMRDLLGRE